MTEVKSVRSVRVCAKVAKRSVGELTIALTTLAVCRGKSVRCEEAISEIEQCRRI